MKTKDVPLYVAALLQNPEYLKGLAFTKGELSMSNNGAPLVKLTRHQLAIAVRELEDAILAEASE